MLWIKYWLMWFESILVFFLFKFKKRPNISGIQVFIKLISGIQVFFKLITFDETYKQNAFLMAFNANNQCL